jgi:uncharacterized protein YecE (DUF72 family)
VVRESIIVGTSSWADPGFVEEWYPPGLPAADRLPYYAERFTGVVNATFYALPALRTVERWAAITPPGFVFDVKLHRLLSRHSAGEDVGGRARELAGAAERVHVMFNNNRHSDAPVAAERLRRLLGTRTTA